MGLRITGNLGRQTYRNQIYLGLGQLVCHASLLYVIFFFDPLYFLGSIAIYFLMTSIGVSVTAHRHLSHRTFEMPVPWLIFGTLFFTLSIQGSTLAWVAMHREHHRFSDRAGDPHNPRDGFLKIHFLSMFYKPSLRYVVDMLGHPVHSFFHRYYWALNGTISLALILAGGLKAAVFLHWFPAFLCWQAIGVAKTWAHVFGYRNFATGDTSHNIPLLGYLTFGEAWHNNHHARPTQYSFREHWHEFDISALLIDFGIRYLGFVPRKTPDLVPTQSISK